MSDQSPLRFGIYSDDSAPAALYEFRYKIYVEEMGRKQKYACADTKTIRDPLDEKGHQGLILRDTDIVGCIRMNLLKHGAVGDYFDFYDLSVLSPDGLMRSSICTRLMIEPSLRRTAASIDLVKFAYEFGLRNGIDTCFIDCNSHLTRFFGRFGWRRLYSREHEEYGLVDVMRLDLRDTDYLGSIDSPFAAIAARVAAGPPEPAMRAAE
jgi:predicted GNAT family N-acyltransferase